MENFSFVEWLSSDHLSWILTKQNKEKLFEAKIRMFPSIITSMFVF